MKRYRFKKVLLIIACFSLVIVMTACGSSGSGGSGSHASISTDPDNPSKLTFPETAENDDGLFYQSIYNSNVDDPDAEPGNIYGCYQGTTDDTGGNFKFIAYKPRLSSTVAQAIASNNLKYFVIGAKYNDDSQKIEEDTLYIFKNDASYDVISRDQKTIKVIGRYIGISLGAEDDYLKAGEGRPSEDYSSFSNLDEEFALGMIDYLIAH